MSKRHKGFDDKIFCPYLQSVIIQKECRLYVHFAGKVYGQNLKN